MTTAFDVVVVGLGAMGSAAAAHLARRGLAVVGFDRHTPPHDQGSSHGGSRIIRCAHFEGPEYAPLAIRSWELWESLGDRAGSPLVLPTGGLNLGAPGSALVEGSKRAAEAHGLPHEMLEAAEVRRRWPVFTPAPGTVALYEEQAGLLRLEAGVVEHLKAAVALGAALVPDTPVLRWDADPSGEGVRVETSIATQEAGHLVLTAGPWTPDLLGASVAPIEVQRTMQCWFSPPDGVAAPPVFIWESDDGDFLYGVPPHDGRGLKVGIHGRGPVCTPESVERTVAAGEIDEVRRALAGRLVALEGEPLEASVCLYANAPDGHFVLGRHPEHPQVFLAAGLAGHGFKFAPVVGEILADLVTTGSTAHPIALFDPGRFRTGR